MSNNCARIAFKLKVFITFFVFFKLTTQLMLTATKFYVKLFSIHNVFKLISLNLRTMIPDVCKNFRISGKLITTVSY